MLYVYGCESKLCMERSAVFRTYATKVSTLYTSLVNSLMLSLVSTAAFSTTQGVRRTLIRLRFTIFSSTVLPTIFTECEDRSRQSLLQRFTLETAVKHVTKTDAKSVATALNLRGASVAQQVTVLGLGTCAVVLWEKTARRKVYLGASSQDPHSSEDVSTRFRLHQCLTKVF